MLIIRSAYICLFIALLILFIHKFLYSMFSILLSSTNPPHLASPTARSPAAEQRESLIISATWRAVFVSSCVSVCWLVGLLGCKVHNASSPCDPRTVVISQLWCCYSMQAEENVAFLNQKIITFYIPKAPFRLSAGSGATVCFKRPQPRSNAEFISLSERECNNLSSKSLNYNDNRNISLCKGTPPSINLRLSLHLSHFIAYCWGSVFMVFRRAKISQIQMSQWAKHRSVMIQTWRTLSSS